MGGTGSGRIPRLKIYDPAGDGIDSGGRRRKPPPSFERGTPEPPERLDETALAVWNDVVDELGPQRILSPHHRELLACFCEAVADYAAARAVLAAEGRTFTNPKTGHTHPHTALADMRASRAEMIRLGREFGLTPASELGLSRVAPSDADDDWAHLPVLPTVDRGRNPFAG